jgi:uroporphyrinogen decarboxylase
MLHNLPVAHPHPDGKRFIDQLMGRVSGGKVPLVEYLVDEVLMRPIVTGLLGREWVALGSDRASQAAYLDNFIQFWYRLGYDFVRFERGMGFTTPTLRIADTAPGSARQRAWADEHTGLITTWEQFERYPWPRVENVDFFPYEYLATHLPEGMGLMVCHAAGVYEHISQIMSYEGLCLALHDAPDLVAALGQRVGELMAGFYRHLLDLPNVIAIFPGDDMGFRTGTLIGPADLRRHVLPWHKHFAALTHARGLPYFLHSCGNLAGIMEDLICDVQIDGKHSYEDVIVPVQEFQARYGGTNGPRRDEGAQCERRIAVLGGLDVDRLTTGSPDEVRRHTRFLIETCGTRGRYAVGSGNSVPSYIPLDNYLAMVDEALSQ